MSLRHHTVVLLCLGLCSAVASGLAPPLSDAEVRELQQLVDRITNSEMTARRFNPRDMVAVVNRLQSLDKHGAMRVLQHRSERNRIVIMRFLFDPRGGELHPTLYLPWDEYRTALNPSFPAVVIEGVPIYLFPLGGWGSGGAIPPVREYFDWYRQNGSLSQQPLRPADDPLAVWQAWVDSPLRQSIANADTRQLMNADQLVQEQLIRMVDTIHPREFDEDTLFREDVSQLWARAVATLETTETRWDEALNIYVRSDDGSYFEPVPEPQYKEVSWRVPVEGRFVHFRVHRLSEKYLRLSLEQVCNDAPSVGTIKVRVVDAENSESEIASIILSGSFVSGTSASTRGLPLAKGMSLRAIALLDNDPIGDSHVMSPDQIDPSPPRPSQFGFD